MALKDADALAEDTRDEISHAVAPPNQKASESDDSDYIYDTDSSETWDSKFKPYWTRKRAGY